MPYQDDHKMIIPEKSEAGEEQLIPAEQHSDFKRDLASLYSPN